MTSTTKSQRRAPDSLAACLGAAQSEAERFFGHGPARSWNAAFDWRPWVAGAALAAVAGLALLWTWGSESPKAGASLDRLVAQASVQAAPGTVASDVAPDAAAVLTAPEQVPLTAPNPAVAIVLPDNLEAWALDPQPLAALSQDSQQTSVSLVNTPEIPDDHDPTPADESTPEEAPVESPAD